MDKKRPGWIDDIDLLTLDLGNSQRCVLGQLASAINADADFATIIERYEYPESADLTDEENRAADEHFQCVYKLFHVKKRMTYRKARQRGFVDTDGEVTYADLDEAWQHLVRTRRAVG